MLHNLYIWFLTIVLFAVWFFFIFWFISNVMSVYLGAPSISSPLSDGWKEFASKDKALLDLGSGSGRMLVRAAPYFKHVYGIEGSPFYYLVSLWRVRNLKNVTVLFGNFEYLEWPETDYIYCYLMTEPLMKIKPLLAKSKATILSIVFAIKGWEPVRTIRQNDRTLYVYDPSEQ